jgi:outer membrane protein TolC
VRSPFRTGVLAGALCAALAGGCVNQDREVETYRKVLDDGRPRPAAFVPSAPLGLGEAMALANENNEQLASQGEDYLQVLIAKNRAFSQFLPTVSFQPNFTVEQPPGGLAAPASPGAPAESAASVAASQGGYVQGGGVLRRFEAPVVGNMDFSYRNIPAYKAAKIEAARQRQLLIDAQETVLLNVAQVYYQVVTSTRQVGVLGHSLSLQEARVRDLRGQLSMKLADALGVAQAEATEAGTRVQLEHAQNDTRNGRRTLALLIGAPSVDGPLDASAADPGALAAPQSFVDAALKGRQDLLAAQAEVDSARQGVKAAVAEYYPSVSLNLTGFLYRENFANATKWDGILLANLPLYSAGQIRSDVRTAWSRLRQAALAESYLHREVEQGVLTAYDNLGTSAAVLLELRREVDSADLAYRQAVQMEKSGLAIPLDVLTAQDTLQNAQLDYASEWYNRTVFYLDLIRSTGDLGPDAPSRLHWTAQVE